MKQAGVSLLVKQIMAGEEMRPRNPTIYGPFKRLIDVVFSFIGLIVLLPLFIVMAIWVKMDSPGPVLFHQIRMTRGMTPFFTLKFRTMRVSNDEYDNQGITSSDKQSRITKSGHFLRKYRFDELPQLLNVLIGDMSLVGPRPQTPRYVEAYPQVYREILTIRPGLTGLASIRFHETEEKMIAAAGDRADEVYINKILPLKFRYNLFYVHNYNFLFDMKIIWWTFYGMWKKRK